MSVSPLDQARSSGHLLHSAFGCLGAFALGIALLTGCFDAKLDSDPLDAQVTTDPSSSDVDSGGTTRSPVAPATAPDKPNGKPNAPVPGERDAQVDPTEPDAGEPVVTKAPAQHASCLLPLPSELPLSPSERGAPSVSTAALDCTNAAPVLECDNELGCPVAGRCLKPTRGARGICVGPDSAPCSSVGYGSGACVSCLSSELRTAACCAGVVGMDCRAWPLAENARESALGELCQRHDDCESGLVCGSPSDFRWGEGWGRCVCPGVNPADLLVDEACEAISGPNEWGKPAKTLPSACVPAKTPGWVTEIAAVEAGGPFAVAADSQNQLHMVSTSFEAAHSIRTKAGWTSQGIPDLLFNYVSMAVDKAGHAHLVCGATVGSRARYATNASGEWTSEEIGGAEGAGSLQIVTDKTNVPHIAYYDEALVDLHYLTREASAWKEYLVSRDQSYQHAMLYVNDKLTWIHGDVDDKLYRVTRSGDTFPRSALTTGEDVSAATTAAGDLLLAFQTEGPVASELASQLSMVRVAGDRVTEEVVWSQSNPRFVSRSAVLPAIGVGKNDRPWIAHNAPEGILLQSYENGRWSAIHVADEGASPKLVIDSEGEPHVFYGVLYEIRHAFRGTCPDAPKP